MTPWFVLKWDEAGVHVTICEHTAGRIVVVGQTGDEHRVGYAHRTRRSTLTDEDRAALVDDSVFLTLGRGGGHRPPLVDATSMVFDGGGV
jgi:hypothetical protein